MILMKRLIQLYVVSIKFYKAFYYFDFSFLSAAITTKLFSIEIFQERVARIDNKIIFSLSKGSSCNERRL